MAGDFLINMALILGTLIKIQSVLWRLNLLMALVVHRRHVHYLKAQLPLSVGEIGIDHCFLP